MRCEYHSGDDSCRLLSPSRLACEGEDNCEFHKEAAGRLCPNCGNKGASWSGWGKHGGFNYTCWTCGHIWVELLVWDVTPGVCRRCGAEIDNPVPEVTHPEGIHDIATSEWCADCNAFTMSILFRESSAYRKGKGELFDPMRGGQRDAG